MKKNTLSLLLSLAFAFLHLGCESVDLEAVHETIVVNNDGAFMPAYVRGNVASKKIIVVLHGGPGGNGIEYSLGEYANQLEKTYGMVYLDQRGQGMAQGKFDATQFTIGKMSEDVYALVLALKAKYGENNKIILLGHSWGGMLGSYFMVNETYQTEVDGWIESNGAHDLPLLNRASVDLFLNVAAEQIAKKHSVEEWELIQTWAKEIDVNSISETQSGEINEKGFEVEKYLENDKEINQGIGGSSLKTILFGPMNWLTSSTSGNFTNGQLNTEIENTALTNQLFKIKKPCLFLYSKYDFVVPAELGKTAFAGVNSTNKKLVIFEKSGHSPMDTEPALFISEVKAFVNSL